MLLIINDETQLENVPEDLRNLFLAYKRMLEKRSEFKKHLDEYRVGKIQKDKFDHICKFLCSFIKYISYRKDKEVFEIRPRTGTKKYTFLGAVKSLDDACEILSEYLKTKMNDNSLQKG